MKSIIVYNPKIECIIPDEPGIQNSDFDCTLYI